MTHTPESPTSPRRLPGAEGLWVLIVGDLALFSLLFASFVSARMKDPVTFEAGRHALDTGRGGINTLLLLTSSWCVVKALFAIRTGRKKHAERWLGVTIGCGAGFAVSKVLEYASEMSAGHTVGGSDFFMYYFTLTGLHLAHVLAGCAVLSVFLARWRSSPGPVRPGGFESAAIFWHLVDLLWILIFPLLYLVR